MVKNIYKLALSLLIGLILFIGGIKICDHFTTTGTIYYTQVKTKGEQHQEKSAAGVTYTSYHYTLNGYDQNGKAKSLQLTSFKARPLKQNSYLKVTYDKQGGNNTQFEALNVHDVPEKVRLKLKIVNK
ncbi:hypothetical protein FC83_GL000505 [Agrilactobacillus composti DSM 18527 = JCM 14202]|uniref:YxeA family protein n=1 Tax=Agrilactobacillus composti DSM 18527 = JCM 14202 TaxID=1423734 RepID=X0PU05_9LACO|nr:YxeA family protein [Agrilactobacillus composti]KRM35947.1 hypothetical protein FC83_GL000505 [Agrilactobacillus composti DSM 18527 = JCM 14202]GAF41527.1 hypothetical protein JCM14202_3475 [Agrilactobacillus composti DSM 18527 = JCM 14202]